MKIVIDTSVWISALIKRDSKARELIRLIFQAKLSPQMSETLFREYEDVMKRKKIQELTPLSLEEQNELFEAYLSTCKWNEIYYMWRPNLQDENDNFIVELAVASGAEAIITYNAKDFKSAELIFKHKIITPEDFIKEMP
ncbi:putative toxin-antitoxin system toxin component, PIN family [Sulfurospirillum sp. T05]|uniref:Toxin-antitoxin system toxin component, PIN family n=1 Tax=Sulfurospirillum tamanense TaxID=2813362 RepID=A0ABS2WVT7_9BACT|nr:putative toxin-antitoxin system toxin component, PIN family [Sulfurospirillum tamanensis]MBN2965334.1 putative toxin-antitoxin system toxin component, PIN family [Sulfurospirillum tamanensis]